jgi:asparagine synthase (glutamine-hydrolysing)
MQMLAGDTASRYALQMSMFKPQEIAALYTGRMRAAVGGATGKWQPWSGGESALDWMMRQDQSGYLPDCLMVKVDIASMANSLEVRSPFLDHEFVAFAASVPAIKKRNGGPGKLVLRSALRDLLPSEILRKRKTGFGIPVARWLRHDLRPLLREHLLGDAFLRRGLFNPDFVRWMVRAHEEGKRDWSNRLWALLVLEMWFKRFVD